MSSRVELGTSRTVGHAPINCATLDEFCSNLADGHVKFQGESQFTEEL